MELRVAIAKLEVQVETIRSEFNRVWETAHDTQLRVGLLERKPPVVEAPVSMWSNVPLHVSEDEEDAKWQLENGMIDKKEYEGLLLELGLEPKVEITNY